jgi:vitamin B12 transporter
MIKKLIITLLFILTYSINVFGLENCKWNNAEGVPCVTVSKTTNTSDFSNNGVNKQIITKQDIQKSGAIDIKGLLEIVPGLDLKQNGQRGQLTSLFMRGTNSNHTLVLLNGIAINDQSTTQGLHNFGQDFVQTIQQIEIYKGASGSHFGPSAIGGAINFITDIDYNNSYTVNGFDTKNNSVDGNYYKITDNGWHLNVKGAHTKSKTGSARYGGVEDDAAKNHQVNLNFKKWFSDNLKFKSTIYSRQTEADYDGSASAESGYTADDKMYALQTSIDHKINNKEESIILHYNKYDREYNEGGARDNYYSDSLVTRGERKVRYSDNLSYGFGSEFKYDRGDFKNYGAYYPLQQVDNDAYNLGIFANAGYKYDDSTTLSVFVRADEHKTTDLNTTYKLNLKKFYKKFDFNITQSTGLRNPSLYELYGSNGRTDSGKHVPNPNAKPEKSLTNEFSIGYAFSENLYISSTGYRSYIADTLLYDSSFGGGSGYTNSQQDLKQKGLETNLIFGGKEQKLSLFNTISSSKKGDGSHQLNRPDVTYGMNYSRKINTNYTGDFNLNYNYKHYGKSFDYNPGIKKVDSTDIMNLSISKEYFNSNFTLQISNLLDEVYQRPIGYSQDGRQFRVNFKKMY